VRLGILLVQHTAGQRRRDLQATVSSKKPVRYCGIAKPLDVNEHLRLSLPAHNPSADIIAEPRYLPSRRAPHFSRREDPMGKRLEKHAAIVDRLARDKLEALQRSVRIYTQTIDSKFETDLDRDRGQRKIEDALNCYLRLRKARKRLLRKIRNKARESSGPRKSEL